MNDKETLDHLWKWCSSGLPLAEAKKWNLDNDVPHDVRQYHQGVADTLRKLLILMRDNPRIQEEFNESWRDHVGGTSRVEPEYLCPEDGSIMRFLFQSMHERRYQCTSEDEHTWAFDWRGAWKR